MLGLSFAILGGLMMREGFSDIVTLGLGSRDKIAQSWLAQEMLRKFQIQTKLAQNAELDNP